MSSLRESAASDASVLALDPHLFDFISFKVLFLLLLSLSIWPLKSFGHNTNLFSNIWQGRQFKHHILTLAMKQVLVHEVSLASSSMEFVALSCMNILIVRLSNKCLKTQVEKQKILQASGGRSGILSTPEIKKTNPDLVRKTTATSNERHRNPVTSKPPSVSVENATTSKPKPSDVKKASRTALSFFDRY